jgi:2-polyprenyl-3-methyl-5-hydroxy-6-metoxy-1,4-benzoquinol methylase
MIKKQHKQGSSDQNVAATLKAYEKIYNEYTSSNSLLNDDVKRNLDQFIGHLNGKRVLDIGCAGGRETAYLASKGLQATGCDLSPSFIWAAARAYPQCSFFVTDMRNIESDMKYDGIWCNAAFLHIPKTDALSTLKGFLQLLKPKGILYLSVMRGDFEGLRENKQMNWPERHFSEYSQKELDKMASDAGFRKIFDASNDTDWGPVFLHGFYQKAL